MLTGNDRKYMERALALASLARGNTSPNPLVGAVIVNDNKIIGEAYHTRAGGAHAEVMAINSVKDRLLMKKATLYVNLEPCCHYGRTPPCSERIIAEKIPRVVIGTSDPSKKVGGRGIRMLKEAGIDVVCGVLEEESREINKRFFTFHERERPYIILKWASSSDGYMDMLRLKNEIGPNWITGMEERMLVHKWRSEEDAILIGDRTACNDDPSLDVRLWGGENPRRFILSESANLPSGLKIFKGDPPSVIFSLNSSQKGSNALYIPLKSRAKAIEEVLRFMHNEEILSVIIEGGKIVLSQFIETGLWDEARVFTGDVVFGKGLKSPIIEGKIIKKHKFKGSILEYIRPKV
ncbi:MAG: bifunctional diaminohydroxyphosphoribosylaminopyrimidine deaminase/5-amino-6-(5-phosphoribosylamino)uracil reductase RibD [Bacteroidales bacterium]|nr:bifunctional diaminohydroxyphosphoribosylaminopyrimidine deaminase/5-amino-6-(5-phosphoribosylamino)uracil reductase RibD [Bacteroidales bacterium]